MVVLHKIQIQSDLAESLSISGFHKEPPGITKNLRFQQPGIMDFCRYFFHKGQFENFAILNWLAREKRFFKKQV